MSQDPRGSRAPSECPGPPKGVSAGVTCEWAGNRDGALWGIIKDMLGAQRLHCSLGESRASPKLPFAFREPQIFLSPAPAGLGVREGWGPLPPTSPSFLFSFLPRCVFKVLLHCSVPLCTSRPSLTDAEDPTQTSCFVLGHIWGCVEGHTVLGLDPSLPICKACAPAH